MVENGLIMDGDRGAIVREIEDLKNKLEGTEVLRWLLQLPDFPTEVDSTDPKTQRATLLGRVRQWISSNRRPGLASTTEQQPGGAVQQGSGAPTQKQTSLFLAAQLQSASKKTLRQTQQLLRGTGGTQLQAPQQSTVQGTVLPRDQALAAGDGKTYATEKGDKGKAKGKGKGKAGGGDCPSCEGTHPECSSCPNSAAEAEEEFDHKKAKKSRNPCWYKHLGADCPCNGVGHRARHHEPLYTAQARKDVEEAREKGLTFGGGSRQQQSQARDQRLDFSEGHEAPAANQSHALRLLEALKCFSDSASKHLEDEEDSPANPRELDLARGPSSEEDAQTEAGEGVYGPTILAPQKELFGVFVRSVTKSFCKHFGMLSTALLILAVALNLPRAMGDAVP